MIRALPSLCAVWVMLPHFVSSSEYAVPSGFRPGNGELASRLVTDRDVYASHQQVWLYLDAFNASESPVELAMGYALRPMLKVVRNDGSELELQTRPASRPVTKSLSPGKITLVMSFFVSGNEHAMFGQLPPGRYRALWEGQASEEPSQGRFAPASNHVEFEIKEASESHPPEGTDSAPIEAGHESNGLRSLLFADRKQFPAGSPLRLFLQVRNETKQDLTCDLPSLPISAKLSVYDSEGEAQSPIDLQDDFLKPPLRITIPAGKAKDVDSVDLAKFYILKPGAYGVKYEGADLKRARILDGTIPESNLFQFEILKAERNDPLEDAVCRLIQRCPSDWVVQSPPPDRRLEQPGLQRGRVACRVVRLHHGGSFGKGAARPEIFPISFFVAEEMAPDEPWEVTSQHHHSVTDYLGETPFGHIYVFPVHETVLRVWPTVKSDLPKLFSNPQE